MTNLKQILNMLNHESEVELEIVENGWRDTIGKGGSVGNEEYHIVHGTFKNDVLNMRYSAKDELCNMITGIVVEAAKEGQFKIIAEVNEKPNAELLEGIENRNACNEAPSAINSEFEDILGGF